MLVGWSANAHSLLARFLLASFLLASRDTRHHRCVLLEKSLGSIHNIYQQKAA